MRDEPASVDLALVLGSPSISNVEPAIALYRSGLTGRIVISGHGPTSDCEPEWRVYRDHARANGVPDAHLIIEPEARNTLENFVLSKQVIDREMPWSKISKLAICCKPIHTRRAYMTARMHLPRHVELLMLPPDNLTDIQSFNWSETPRGRARVMGEIHRIAEYASKGDISIE